MPNKSSLLSGSSPSSSDGGNNDSVALMREIVLETLSDMKGVDLVCFPLPEKTALADYMVIASGRSVVHIKSMAYKLVENIRAKVGIIPKINGLTNSDWVVLDARDIIIHLFLSEVRSFYKLEKMWSFDAERDDLENQSDPDDAKTSDFPVE